MQQTFTKEFMLDNRGCYSESKVLALPFEGDTITLKAIVNSGIPLKDKYWFVCNKLATKEENQQIAITLAEIVLLIYEKRHPNNKAPREAIEAARAYIAGHISLEELRIKRAAAAANAANAAYAANAAANAAYAAYAATAAAYAATTAAYAATAYAYADAAANAAYAAAYAAYAAYAADAADAAAYAADAADAAADAIKQQLQSYLKSICA